MADISDLVARLASHFGCEPTTEEDGTVTVEIETSEGEPVPISVYADEIDEGPAVGGQVVMMRAAAGEDLDDLDRDDLLELLMASSATWFGRLYLEEDTASLVAEAALPLTGLRFEDLLQAAREVADLADACLAAVDEED
jgi:hypothetical protein